MSALMRAEDYQDCFDPQDYLRVNWTLKDPRLCGAIDDHWPYFILRSYQKFFSSLEGKMPANSRMLDIGTGPCVAQLISASGVFSDITCTDFVKENRRELKRCLYDFDNYTTFDWVPHFEFVAEKEGLRRDQWRDLLHRVQNSVKQVLPSNVFKPNPLDPVILPPFDCIACNGVFEVVSTSEQEWQTLLGNCLSLLRPGGVWIQMVTCGLNQYSAGGNFGGFGNSANVVIKTLSEAGLINMEFDVMRDPKWTQRAGYCEDYAFLVVKAVREKLV